MRRMNVLLRTLLDFCVLSGISKGIVGLTTCTGISANVSCGESKCRINPSESVCLICNVSRDTRGISWHIGNRKLAREDYNTDLVPASGLVVNGCGSKEYSLKLNRPNTNHTDTPYFCRAKRRIIAKFCLKFEEISSPNYDNTSLRIAVSHINETTEDQHFNKEPSTCQQTNEPSTSQLTNELHSGAKNIWIPIIITGICLSCCIICGCNRDKGRKDSLHTTESIHRSSLNNEEPNELLQDYCVIKKNCTESINSAHGENTLSQNALGSNNLLKMTAVTKLRVSGTHEYWQGKFTDGCQGFGKCFVKTLSDEATLHEANAFKIVAKHRANISSANVVRLLGLKNEDGRCSMIYEYLEFGSLRDFVRTQFHERGLRPEEEFILQVQRLLTLASDIASAMAFIVSQNFVHPVLSLKKVLLSEQFTCKLYDIYPRDMAMMKINNVIKKSHSRIAWMPPETIFLSTYSSCSDIWSFAVTLWELFSLGETPYAGRSIKEIEHNIRTNVHLRKPPDCPEAVYEVMLNSWDKNDKARPPFADIKQKLQNILTKNAERFK